MYNNRKGQAAMEFLMTYGWAILAAIVAIGVLVYFGAFSPAKLTSELCTLSTPFGCGDDSMVRAMAGTGLANDNITLVLTNGGSETVNLISVNITNCGGASNSATSIPIPAQLASGETNSTVLVGCTTDIGDGATFRGDIKVVYTKAGGTRVLESTGSIVRKNV